MLMSDRRQSAAWMSEPADRTCQTPHRSVIRCRSLSWCPRMIVDRNPRNPGYGAYLEMVAVGWPAGERGEGALAPDRWGQGPRDPMTGMVRGSCEACEAITGPGCRCRRPEIRTGAGIPGVAVRDPGRRLAGRINSHASCSAPLPLRIIRAAPGSWRPWLDREE